MFKLGSVVAGNRTLKGYAVTSRRVVTVSTEAGAIDELAGVGNGR